MDKEEIYFKLYQEEWIQCRHHGDLRAKVTSVLLAAAGAITALVVMDRQITGIDFIPGFILSLMGVFGAIVTLKQHERFSFHLERARAYRNELERIKPDLNLRLLRNNAESISQSKHAILFKLRLDTLWAIIHLIICGIGILIMVQSSLPSGK